MKVKHVEETCTECGKTITKRAIAHVYNNLRVVCTACMHKLEAKDEREADRSAERVAVENERATERQIRFAHELGIPNPERYGKWALSEKITEAVDARDDREAEVRYVPVYKPAKRTTANPWVFLVAMAAVVLVLLMMCAGLMKR